MTKNERSTMYINIFHLIKGDAMETQESNIKPVKRKRFEIQGYQCYSNSELHDFKFGIRFAYYLCGYLVILGLLLK